jgi:hypothetical protein
MSTESITCPDPHCGMTSYHPQDVRWGWCAACGQFAWAIGDQSLNLNLILADFMKANRYELGQGSPFSFQMETFLGQDGTMKFRALVKFGERLWKYSTREHSTPADALRELSEIAREDANRMDRRSRVD